MEKLNYDFEKEIKELKERYESQIQRLNSDHEDELARELKNLT